MSPSEFKPGEYARNILSRPTDRDQQVSIGASNLSNPCARCLAEQMLSGQESTLYGTQYWLGAVIGTAVHAYLDERNTDPNALKERKVTIGEIPGYGVVRSTSDLFHKPAHCVVDWKTTVRDKLVYIKRALTEEQHDLEATKTAQMRHKVSGYVNQIMLYGLGMENEGETVERVALVFICRDGKGDADIWGWDTEYDREHALKVFDRGARLWAWLQEGHTPDELPSAYHCWPCSMRRE